MALEETDREFDSIESLVGMLNLEPVELTGPQREALEARRREAALEKSSEKEQAALRLAQARREREAAANEEAASRAAAQQAKEEAARAESLARQRAVETKRARMQQLGPDGERRVTARVAQYTESKRFVPAEIDAAKQAFGELDAAGVGGFTADDVRSALEQIGETPGQGEVDAFIREINQSGSGVVTFDEFLDGLDKLGDAVTAVLAVDVSAAASLASSLAGGGKPVSPRQNGALRPSIQRSRAGQGV